VDQKGPTWTVKARVHPTRKKQMVLAFFDNNGLISTNYVPSCKTVNTLSRFLAIFKKK
jgi:hypothetical protein